MLIIKEDGDVLDTEGMRKDCYMKCGKHDMIYLYIGDPSDPGVDPEADDPRATNNMLYKTTDRDMCIALIRCIVASLANDCKVFNTIGNVKRIAELEAYKENTVNFIKERSDQAEVDVCTATK